MNTRAGGGVYMLSLPLCCKRKGAQCSQAQKRSTQIRLTMELSCDWDIWPWCLTCQDITLLLFPQPRGAQLFYRAKASNSQMTFLPHS